MTLLLLRHADAGARGDWQGDDRDRPLNASGRAQAEAIVGLYAAQPIERILTSPYARCVQTVEPLAAARGLDVEVEEDLAEGTPPDLVWRLLRRLGGTHAVLCTHGDIVESVVTSVASQGGAPDGQLSWHKASTWIVDLGDGRARYVPDPPATASYLPPPG